VTNLVRILDALATFEGDSQSWLVGTPCFDPPTELMRGLQEAANTKPIAYGPPGGSARLREAVAEFHRRKGDRVDPENVVITPGAKAGILVVLAALVEPGDEVSVPVPGYPAYVSSVQTVHANPILVEQTGESFDGWIEKLQDKLSSRTRLVIVASPSNPTGATLSGEQVGLLCRVCRESGATFVLDEAYGSFVFERALTRSTLDPEGDDAGIVVRSFSKSYALCGLRLGYIVAPRALTKELIARQSSLLNPPNTVAQIAAQHLLDVPSSYEEQARNLVRERLSELAKVLSQVGLQTNLPQGGFYLWVDIRHELTRSGCSSTLLWCENLAREQGIGAWPGEDFGAPGWVRFSAVAPRSKTWTRAIETLSSRLQTYLG
jgi:aspartate aminotransferase